LLVEAFAVERSRLDEKFAKVAKEVGFIDVLFPRFIAYESLYDKESQSSDLFFYIGEEEAFAAIYQKGKFIGFRQLEPLSAIASKSGIELAKLKSFLSKKGLVIERYAPEEMHVYEALSQSFYKNVEKVVYAVNFKRSYFGIEKIDRVILDFEGESVAGLKELFEGFGYEDVAVEVLECCGVQKEASVLVLANYVLRYEELDQKLNFSVYERKKPLYTYPVVQLAAAVVIFTIALGGFGWYLYLQNEALDEQIAIKERQLQNAKTRAKRYVAELKKLKIRKAELKKEIAKLEEERLVYQETLDMIPYIQDAKLARERMINDVVEGLYTYKLSTESIDQNSSKSCDVKLVSVSNEREKIAKFMDYLYKKGYTAQTYSIIGKKGVYQSVVKVRR
jgi:cell division protein FtsB